MTYWTRKVWRALLLAVSVLAIDCVYADTWTDPKTGITWTYVVQGGCAQVGGGYGLPAISQTTTGAITIPDALGEYPVTSIDYHAFYKCSGLTSVWIPSGVKNIEDGAFSCCQSMDFFVVDNTNPSYKSVDGMLLTKDGNVLVAGVNGDVTIPDGVTRIEDDAFEGYSNLTSVIIPSSLTSIGGWAFCSCSNLTNVTIPSSITSIGAQAFISCSSLTSVVIPSSVTNIGAGAFSGCQTMDSFIVDDANPSYKSVDGMLLTKDGKVLVSSINDANIMIPFSVTDIGEVAFYKCSSLTSVTIPSSVTNIGDLAFNKCISLESVWFEGLPPNGLVGSDINDGAQIYYNSTYSAEWAAVIAECGFTNAIPYTPVLDGGPYKEMVDGVEWTYMVQDGCSQVGIGGYSSPSSAVPVTTTGAISIPSVLGRHPVTSIGNYAFSQCSELTCVTIPYGITNIGWKAFAECIALTNVDIPASVEVLSGGAFAGCKSLESVSVPGSIRCIGEQSSCVMDYSYVYPAGATSWSTSGRAYTSVGAFEQCYALRSVVIGEGVQEIGFRAFKQCKRLQSVSIPNSLKKIYAGVFSECIKLDNLVLPQNLTSLGEGVVSQDDGVFFRCVSLAGMTIPDSVSVLGDYAFAGCTSFKSLRFDGDEPIVSGWCVLLGTPKNLVVEVHNGTLGWYNGITYERLAKWQGRTLSYDGEILVSTKELSEEDRYKLRNNLLATLEALKKTGVTLSESRRMEYLQWAMDIAEDCPSASETVVEFAIGLGVTLTEAQRASLVDWGVAIVQNQASGSTTIVQQHTNNVTDVSSVNLTVTNVVVHYVLNSIQPEIAVPITPETGIVTVMTEVKGGNMAIPDSWASNYPSFTSKFGSDFTKALMMSSGKVDAAGNEMFVWQDFVAGTDPTDPDDKFTASVTIVDGVPVVSWTPELSAEQAALRKYTTYGKAKLQDENWSVVNGDEANYNFFKVTVEMK